MLPRLIPWPRAAAVVVAICVAVVAALGAIVHGDGGTAFDHAIHRAITAHFGPSVLDALLALTYPPLVIASLAALALVTALLHRWEITALAVTAPVVAVLVTEKLLKPLVHRTMYPAAQFYAYPSGHETAFGSLVAVLGLLLIRSAAPVGRKVTGLVLLAALVVAAAVGLIGRSYHFATDTIGGVGVAIGCTVGLGLVIDAVHARLRAANPVN
jgi:membrane-associated phospholipid phosphatase